MYAKLIGGVLRRAPRMLHVGQTNVWNAPAEEYAAQGWKPVEIGDPPQTAPEGYAYECGWAETDGAIVQTWTLVELPYEEMSAEEALDILLGGEGA